MKTIDKLLLKYPWSNDATWCLVVFVAVVALGGPVSSCDDYFFIGSGFHMSETGELRNPFLSWIFLKASGFTSDAFYFHLPLPTYLIAYWCRIFGISSFSLECLYNGTYALGALAFVRLLAAAAVPFMYRLSVAAAFVLVMQPMGFRTEGMAFSILCLGIMVAKSTRLPVSTMGWILIGLSVLTYPITFGPGVIFGMALLFQMLPGQSLVWRSFSPRQLWAAFMAALVCLGLFYWMVAGQVVPFWEAYQKMAALANPAALGDPMRFYRFIDIITSYNQGILTFPILVALVGICITGLVARRKNLLTREQVWFIAMLFLSVVGAVALAHLRSKQWMMACGFAAVAILLSRIAKTKLQKAAAASSLFIWVFVSQIFSLLHLGFQEHIDPALCQQIREQVEQSGKKLRIDGQTSRYVYDFRLPKDTLDITWCRGNVWTDFNSPSTQPVDEIWLVNRHDVGVIGITQEPMQLGPKKIMNISRRECDPWIIENGVPHIARELLDSPPKAQ